LSRGTYHRPNNPITSPVTQVQIHHLASAGRRSRTITKTISATAQPAVTLAATSWSFASSGGGGVGRPGSFTPPG
jgi:hypothetical protein